MKIQMCKFSEARALAGGLDFHENPMDVHENPVDVMNIQIRENPTCKTPSLYSLLKLKLKLGDITINPSNRS